MRQASILAVVLATACTALYAHRAAAQCHPGWVNGGCVTWPNFPFSNGQHCDVTICYCFTGPGLTPKSYEINSVLLGSGCDVNNPDGQMMRDLGLALVKANPAGFTCPTCPNMSVQINTGWASCVTRDPINGSGPWVPCPGAEGACIDAYTICCTSNPSPMPPTVWSTFLWHANTSDCTDPNCRPVCPQ